jgi:hypothetical protein
VVPTATDTRFLSAYHWTSDRDGFGGYSAIVLTPDGTGFLMMSDRTHLIEGTIHRHEERIIGIRSGESQPVRIPDGLLGRQSQGDTEGLARGADGRIYISLEADNRIISRTKEGDWSILPSYPAIDALPPNKGLEALAIAPDETIYALPEASDGLLDPFPVFRYRSGTGWDQPMSITRSRGHVPVGADVGPDGRLYVLERGFAGFGFYSRVRRFDLTGKGALAGETLLTTDILRHDNLEGISVWQAGDGTLRLTMVSDDNFLFFQRTEIVEYAVGI